MAEVIKVTHVICAGKGPECDCCEITPCDPGCDLGCLDIIFAPPYVEDYSTEGLQLIEARRSLVPGDGSMLCDGEQVTGEVRLVKGTGGTVNWEVVHTTDTSTAIWTLISKSHSNGDSGTLAFGSDSVTITLTWQYNESGVMVPGDLIGPEEDCCITYPEIGIEFTAVSGTHHYHLSDGGGSSGASLSMCGEYIPCP